MSEYGANLQTYNQELVKCLEDLKVKRNSLQNIVDREENEKNCLEKKIEALKEKLKCLSTHLAQHKYLRDSYDKTIQDTQAGFKKILESSETLLNLTQHEASNLENQIARIKLDT